MTEMNNASNKIKKIMGRLDDIDQETLVEMLSITDDAETGANTDPATMLEESKNQVLTFMQEIKELSESQEAITESLRTWFQSLRTVDGFLEGERQLQPIAPERRDVYEALQKIVEECSVRTEQAATLHNGVSEFLQKQMSQYRQVINSQNDEIRRLNELIERVAVGRPKKSKKKNRGEDLRLLHEIDAQSKTIEEQKATIEKLRQDLQKSELSRVAMEAGNAGATPLEEIRKQSLQRVSAASSQVYEAETRLVFFKERIERLEADNKALNKQLSESKMMTKRLQKTLENKEAKIKELEATNKKNLQLLLLEREKDGQQSQGLSLDMLESSDDQMVKITQLKEEIRAMKNEHLADMMKQSEAMRAKFLVEKRLLLDAVEDKATGAKLRALIDDYEQKMDKQKQDFDTINEAIVKQFGAKIMLLTKQYEVRIKLLNASHQKELITQRNRQKFEIKKKELDLEERFNMKVIDLEKNSAIKNRKLMEETDELRRIVSQVQLDNNKYKQVIEGFLMAHPDFKDELGTAIHSDILPRDPSSPQITLDGMTMEQHEVRLGCLRLELEDQTKWLLDEQKQDFERQLEQVETAHQIEIRDLLAKVQAALSQCVVEGETVTTLSEATEKIADVLLKMNEHHELDDAVKEPTITLEEADNRMKELKEKIHTLLAKFGDPEQSALIAQFLQDDAETERIQELKERIRVLESLQQGDVLKELENLRAEIAARDAILNTMTGPGPWSKYTGELRESLVFHYQGDHDDEPVRKIPIQRSLPGFMFISGEGSNATSVSQDFSGQNCSMSIGTKALPDTVPVVMELKNADVQSSATEDPKSLLVKTMVGAGTKAARSKKRYGQASMVEIATQIAIRNESVFAAMDASNTDAIRVELQKKWRPNSLETRAKKPNLCVSRLVAINVPETAVELIPQPDPETVDAINELEDVVAKNSRESGEVDKDKLFTEMRIAVIDARNRIIARQKAIIDELMNREPVVIHDTQIVTIVDERDDDVTDRHPKREFDMEKEIERSVPRKRPEMVSTEVETKPMQPRIELDSSHTLEIDHPETAPPAVYDRPPPTPVVIDMGDEDVDIDEVEDPFTEAIQMIAANIRFMANFSDNEDHISRTMKGDADAYEAFLSATENTEEAHRSFLNQLKETSQCFTDNQTQLSQFNSMQKKLLEMLKVSKKKAKELTDIIQDFKTAETNKRLQKEQHLLKNLTSDANAGAYANQLLILDRLFSSLQFVNQPKVTLTPEHVQTYNELLQRISDMRNQLNTKKPVPQKDLEDLIDDAHVFVSAVKPDGVPSMNEVLASTSMSEVRNAQRKVKKLNTILSQLEKQLESEKEKSKSLNTQLESLKSRLNEEKDLNENTISLYQTQVQVLKDALKALSESSGQSSANATNVVSSVKSEILSLQALLEASVSERDLFKGRASDLEDQIVARDDHIKYLNQQVEGTTNINNELETENRKLREEIMFHEADMDNLRREREADRALAQQLRHQLETTLGKNAELHNRVSDLKSRKNDLKNEVGELKEAMEYYEVHLALGSFSSSQPQGVSIGTQTMVREIAQRKTQTVIEPDTSIQEELPRVEKQEISEAEDPEAIYLEPQECEQEDAGSVLSTPRTESKDESLEEQILHRPLLSQRRPKTAIDKARPRTAKGQKTPVFVPLKVSIQATDEKHLAIGLTKQGQRQLPGQKGPVRPTITTRTVVAMKAGAPHTGRTNALQNKPNQITRPGSAARPSSSHGLIAYAEEEPTETIRITRIKYLEPEKEDDDRKAPIIAPVSRFACDCDPMSVTGGVSRQVSAIDIEQISKLALRLQHRVTRLQQTLSKKEDAIITLKRKLTDLTRQNQRLEVDCTRYQDRAKRVGNRLSNAQARLDIVMKELEIQEDTESLLRKEIMRLKLSAAPAREPLARLQKAHAEQDRLKREKRQKKAVLAATKTAIDKVGNKTVREHLENLMGNTERSIARLEAKKRMWKNMERKNILSALSAVSLINDEQTNAVFPVHQIAAMNKTKLMAIQDVWLSRNHMSGEESVHITTPRQPKPDSEDPERQTVTSYSKTLEMIDRLDLPATEQAKVVKGEMTPEIVEQLNKMEEADREPLSLSMSPCVQPLSGPH